MNFKEWLNGDNIASEVEQIIVDLKNNALRSLKVANGRIVISFRTPLVGLHRQQVANADTQMALAAHTEYEGPQIQEKSKDSDENWAHRHDKGWTAYRGLEKLADPVKDLGWDNKMQYRFKSNLTHAVADIAQPLGFIFELDVFLALKDKLGLKDGDEGRMNVEMIRAEYVKKIETRLGQARQQIFQMLEVHSLDLAKQIVQRSKRLLNCVTTVWFTGGRNTSFAGRENPADIQIGCEDENRIGYSVKFGSETRISIAKFTPKTAIEITLGDITDKQLQAVSGYSDEYENEKEWIAALSQKLYQIIAPKYENNPRLFVQLLNGLLTGGHNTFPAPRNYASTELGGAEWSNNFRKDFNVSDHPASPLRAKKDAKVEVGYNNSYFRMTYKVPGGNFAGTTLFFIPRGGMVDVKVNNLTSGRHA